MKKIDSLISLLGVAFFSFLTFILIQEIQYSKRFSETELNISIEELKEKWGNPDEDFICKNCDNKRILKYSTFSGIGKYVFKFQNSTKLIFKYDDGL